jgi:hypothetical protein
MASHQNTMMLDFTEVTSCSMTTLFCCFAEAISTFSSGDNEVARNSGARSSINRSDLKTEEMKIQAEVEECALANCEVTHF